MTSYNLLKALDYAASLFKETNMRIRKTKTEDIDKIIEIYTAARRFMRENGNPSQWNKSYPERSDILSDIAAGNSYVCEDRDEIVAAFYFCVGVDPTYEKIYNGSWKNTDEYGVIHRIAVKYNGRGIVGFCFDECYKIIPNLRIDTHRDNFPMQRALLKSGFQYCGIIYLESGDERLAYQK